MKKNNTKNVAKIKCDVSSCDFNDFEEGTCCLKEITISCLCPSDCCHENDETICQSFKETSANINDNIYEVDSETEK